MINNCIYLRKNKKFFRFSFSLSQGKIIFNKMFKLLEKMWKNAIYNQFNFFYTFLHYVKKDSEREVNDCLSVLYKFLEHTNVSLIYYNYV